MLKDKQEFLHRKKGIRNEADITAQQLINIYRQLAVLGDNATERYNKQLIEQVNPDVMASFKSIPGGDEVRDYYNFLTHADDGADTQKQATGDNIADLLPQAEEISPLWSYYQAGPAIPNGNAYSPVSNIPVASVPVNSTPAASTPAVVMAEPTVITKTVQVRVGFDEEKVKQGLGELGQHQKQALKDIFDKVVIDSNIETMHTQLKEVRTQVAHIFDDIYSQINRIVSSSKIEEKPVVVSQTEENKKRPTASAGMVKNVRRKSEHKFSVDMVEEE